MVYLGLGSIGFLAVFLFDLVSLQRIRFLKPIFWLAGMVLIGYGHYGVNSQGPIVVLPTWLPVIGWPLLIVASLAFIYSLFLELPLKNTYIADGVGQQLVTSGTYALTRHPGVLWYALVQVSLLMIFSRQWMLLAIPLWLGLDILHVWIQDRYLFPRMFPDYELYQQQTPMLLPTPNSIERCISTFSDGWQRQG